ncbi:MAG: hypothetical protein NUV45_15205 [Tepidanaerobacteraceae bacterium]|jgi:4-hydroxy-tetrahydrodipicolinate synthase|nr:hypothetical protein [Tepidanaerobacteraceae bacterium]
MAEISKPWDSIEQIEKCRNLYLKYYPLLQALYWLSNPIVVKAAMDLLGLPVGNPGVHILNRGAKSWNN